MAAPDIHGVTAALAAIVSTIPGLATHQNTPQVFEGPQEAWARTPSAEVIADDVDLAGLAAGAHQYLVSGVWHVVFYESISSHPERHEAVIQDLVKTLLDKLVDPTFDRTLGGLTEDLRAVRVTFDVTRRNNKPYRVAAVTLQLEA